MNEFINLFISETKATIEGLTGESPEMTMKDASSSVDIATPVALVTIDVSGDATGKMLMAIPPKMATALVDMMMAGEGESKEDMNEDDLDGTKEIASNIAGAIGTALSSQNVLPKLSLVASNIAFISESEDVDVEDFAHGVTFAFKTAAIDDEVKLILDTSVEASLNPQAPAAEPEPTADFSAAPSGGGGADLSNEEMRNMALLREVKLPVTVRIGSKKMLLKDVINMDIGSVIELNQLANDPLDLLVDNHVIAQGEVVIVDGNFGIQITYIGSKRDRLNQLKG
jgi:flagellar motor switch protein FliN/FliY